MISVAPALALLLVGTLQPADVDTVTPGPGAGRTDPVPASIPRIAVLPERPQMNLSSDPGSTLGVSLEVLGIPAGVPLTVRGLANVGRVDSVTPTGTWGRFVARYVAPVERFPQVAIIAFEATYADRRARGVVRVPLLASTEIPFRTDPQAQVTLRVGDRTFGPVTADATGKVKIPVVVPPGVDIGQARAISRDGNLNETIVDLQPTAYPRALIVAPTRIEVGTIAELAVFGTEPTGDPTPPNRLSLHASQGLVHAVAGVLPGEVRFLFETPTGADLVTLEATKLGDPAGAARAIIPVQPGAVRTLKLTPSTSWLVIGSGNSARVNVAAQDRFGNPIPCQGVAVTSAGAPVPIDVSPTGDVAAVVRAPDRYQGQESLLIEAALADARARTEVLLSGGPPARLSIELGAAAVVADGRRGVEVRVNAVDANGAPTMISGISWELPGGRLGSVRKPRVGSYVVEFIPLRAGKPHSETLAVMASQTVRASVSLQVEPPRARVELTARAAFFSNLGSASGPAGFVDAVRPLPGRAAALAVGLRVGYLHDDITTKIQPDQPSSGTRIEIHQFPITAIGRYRLALNAVDISVGGGLGVSLARTRLTPPLPAGGTPVESPARALALEAGAEAAFPLAPGRLVVGLRYLWVEFGRTSLNDQIRGNSAGFVAELGYRLAF